MIMLVLEPKIDDKVNSEIAIRNIVSMLSDVL